MITMHCTYPDGETSEARFATNLETMLMLQDPGFDGPDTLVDEYAGSEEV